ncbi:hypothetical protein DFH06DRAFT_1030318 [Mycena polygramma]|nr:hypothetical protein DFH06DRAFT_1030318 [Mycena polygramma]
MDGVPQLRARIEALSSLIDLQRELLRNLERDKSVAQRQLNAVLDPMARLPVEISSEIFVQCLPLVPERPGLHAVPMSLLHVCNAWTSIALSTPALWATICVGCPCTKGLEEGSRTWLQRAGDRPLSLSVRGRFGPGDVPAFIWEYGERFKHLAICEEEDENYNLELENFIGTHCPTLPLLETFTIRGSALDRGEFSGLQILELLRSAPNLIACTLQEMCYDEIETTTTLGLPALRHLIFGERTEFPPSNDDILKYLTLPALQTLRVPLNTASEEDLLLMLRRSSPPLKELSLGSVHHTAFLELVPTLKRFEIWNLSSDAMNKLSLALVESPSFLPDLRALRIHTLYGYGDVRLDSCWELLLRVLSSRPKLRLVLCVGYEREKPAADILARFGGLVKNGRQIYIGVFGEDSNWVCV